MTTARVAVELTRTQVVERLSQRTIGHWSDDELLAIASAIGRGLDVFTPEDCLAFMEWAEQVAVDATLLHLVLEGRMVVRMTGDDDSPEFILREGYAQVPRANQKDRLRVGPFESAKKIAQAMRILVQYGAPPKNEAAVALGKLGGQKGGNARAAALAPAQRSAIASAAARARWGK